MMRRLIVGAIVVNFLFMLVSVFAPSGIKLENTALAVNTTAGYTATGTVLEVLEINAILKEMLPDGSDINFASNPSGLDFGNLVAVKNVNNTILYMRGSKSYATIMYPATSGRKYKLQVTGEPLTGSNGGSIGDGSNGVIGSTQDAYVVVPDYQWADTLGGVTQGAPPPGALVKTPARLASATNYVLYDSGPAGFGRAVRAYLGIGGPAVNGKITSCSQGHNSASCEGTAQDYDNGGTWDLVTPNQLAGNYDGSVTFTLTLY